MERQFFNLPGNPQMNTPFDKMHIWEWMTAKFLNREESKISVGYYLFEIGFTRESHKLTETQSKILRYAVEHFFRIKRTNRWSTS